MRAVLITGDRADPSVAVTDVDPSILEGDVTIAVEFAGVNFKDAMVTRPQNRVLRRTPLIGGVDLAGRVLEAPPGGPMPGTPVLAHGHSIGVAHHGGFAPLARVPSEWVVEIPQGLDSRSAMALGTAGFTAMASLRALERAGVAPEGGPILVTGASGGVGTTSVAVLAAAGYEVVASTGSNDAADLLTSLGARSVIGRDEIDDRPERTLGSERWAGAVDCVGGATLAAVLRSLRYGGAVAASGLTGGNELATTVYPFIVRGVSLLGIDAVEMPFHDRLLVWNELASRIDARVIELIVERTIGLDEVPDALDEIGRGGVRGRILVDPNR